MIHVAFCSEYYVLSVGVPRFHRLKTAAFLVSWLLRMTGFYDIYDHDWHICVSNYSILCQMFDSELQKICLLVTSMVDYV